MPGLGRDPFSSLPTVVCEVSAEHVPRWAVASVTCAFCRQNVSSPQKKAIRPRPDRSAFASVEQWKGYFPPPPKESPQKLPTSIRWQKLRAWSGLWGPEPLCCSGAVLRVQGSGSCSEIGTAGCADDDTPPATQPLWYFG